MRKKITLLFALLCVSLMGWATKYCNTLLNNVNGENPVYLSCYHVSGTTTYRIEFSSTNNITITGKGGCNVEVTKSGVLGGISFEYADNKVYAEFESSDTPTKTTGANDVFLNIPGENRYNLPADIDFSATCDGSGGEDPTPPARTGYCGDDIFNNTTSADDPYKVKVTSAVFGENYVLCFESAHPTAQLNRLDGANFWCNTSGDNCHMSDNYKIIDGKVYFIVPSTSAPRIYTDFCFFFNDNQQRVFNSVNNVTFTACSEAVDFGVDFIAPSITAASLVSKTSAQAVISITATDDVGVAECAVYDGTAHLGDYVVSDGKITVTELMYNHAYTLTIKAKDATGNISANSVNVSVTTDDNTAIIDESVAFDNGNMALTSAGSSATATSGNAGEAIDDNTGSRWESAHSDPQTWTLDLGQERVFNNIQISWEGAYGKTFTLAISNDNANWTTIYYVNGQALAGFPYLQDIDLPQLKARYIRFHGMERGTGYGYSFYEFRVQYKVSAVLTTIAAEIDKRYCKIGTGANLSLAFKDQYGSPIEHGAVSYNISPDASYGSVSEGVFTPAKSGLITITAQVGSIISNAVTIWGTSSDNIAKNKLHSASTGEAVLEDRPAANAVDDNEGTEWQSHAGTTENVDAEYEYNSWLIIDLEDKYDVELVSVKFEGASSQIYTIDFVDDLAHEWKEGASYSGSRGTDPRRDEYSSTLQNNSGVRYVKLNSTKAATHYGMKVQEIRVFGTLAATPTKSVSASVNDAAMGTATVKQDGSNVTEVETGSTVTFSAVANDGYLFTGWSNGETRATFDVKVNAAMNLTANFRALGNVFCNTLVHSSNGGQEHDAYVTMTRTSENNYKLIVRSTETLGKFTGTVFNVNGNSMLDLRDQGTLSNENHTLTYEFTSTTTPSMNSPYLYLYVMNPNNTECWFTKLENIEFDVPCDDNVSVTSITLSQNSANLLVEKTLTLTPTFAPVYATDRALTWETSDASVATVGNGVVTAVAEGNATITAKLTSNNSIYATCNVRVVASLTEATWHGYVVATTPTEGNILVTYAVTRDVEQYLTFSLTTDKDLLGFVAFINIAGVAHELTGYGAEHTATFTTTDKYEDNMPLNCMWDVRGAGYGQNFNFTYRVGSENAALKTLSLSETQDNISALTPLDGQEVTMAIVNRSFAAGNLYTLVLPFNVDVAMRAEKLPGQLTRLNNTIAKENGDLRINFVDAESVEAGVPYLYTPSADVTNPVFTGVTVNKGLHPTEPADGYAEYHGIYAPMDGSQLHGITNGYVLGGDRYLYTTSSLADTQTMNALRGYFVLNFPTGGGANGAPRARVVFNSHETETTTDVSHVQDDNVPCTKVIRDGQLLIMKGNHTYNAQGQLIK